MPGFFQEQITLGKIQQITQLELSAISLTDWEMNDAILSSYIRPREDTSEGTEIMRLQGMMEFPKQLLSGSGQNHT